MKTVISAIAAIAALSAVSASAGDELGTLRQGRYICALPGDATGLPINEVPEHNFRITGASSYEAPEGRGTYLRVGETVTFTRGPRKDMKLKLLGSGLLQWVKEDGSLGRIRCSRVSR